MNMRRMCWVAVVLLAALQSAWAFYNPQTGRWLNRDGIAEQGGQNLYEFARNEPVSLIDRLGLLSLFRKPCCCCCIEDLKIQNILKVNQGASYGHYFEVRPDLAYKLGPKGLCSLRWMEKSNRPPEDGVPPGKWYDAGALHPNGPVWQIWHGHSLNPPCPGQDSMALPDEPTADTELPTRITYFAITVRSTPGCPCTYASRTILAKQVLSSDGSGKITEQDFTVLDPGTISGPDDGPQGPPYPAPSAQFLHKP